MLYRYQLQECFPVLILFFNKSSQLFKRNRKKSLSLLSHSVAPRDNLWYTFLTQIIAWYSHFPALTFSLNNIHQIHGWFMSMYGKIHYNIVISLQLKSINFKIYVHQREFMSVWIPPKEFLLIYNAYYFTVWMYIIYSASLHWGAYRLFLIYCCN